MKVYTTIDHTADIGILVHGKDLKTLFENSAWAMFDQMTRLPKMLPKVPPKTVPIEIHAENINDLLVRWLSELLTLSECKDLVFTKFKIAQLTDKKLKGQATGLPRQNFIFKTEIKAVTYHELNISKNKKEYSAQVIFDV